MGFFHNFVCDHRTYSTPSRTSIGSSSQSRRTVGNIIKKRTIMKNIFIAACIFLLIHSTEAQSISSDTLKVAVVTKFGELTFTKYCKKDTFNFVQSGKPIFDNEVEQDAKNQNITEQKLKIKFTINEAGKLESCEILKPSKLKSLNVFLLEMFNDAILKLNSIDYNLSCDGKKKAYTIPVVYKAQKSK